MMNWPILDEEMYLVVMKYAMSMGLDKEDLLSVSRVKGRLGVIFLSDMVTADNT